MTKHPLAHGDLAGHRHIRLHGHPNRFLATVQIGITLAGFLASATAAVTLAEPLEEILGFLGAAARPVAVVLVTAVLVFLTLVIGELARGAWRCSAPSGGHWSPRGLSLRWEP